MGILKDWKEDSEGYRFRNQVVCLFSPKVWFRLHKWRMQRANRGWSNRDTWGAGEHIAKMTAEMLQHLNDNTYVDWPEWFKLNVKEKGKGAYKNLQSVIDDINKYLEHTETSWGDGLTTKAVSLISDDGHYSSPDWYDEKTGKKLSEPAINNRINKWAAEEDKLYKKAIKAMGFFSRHFSGFWD